MYVKSCQNLKIGFGDLKSTLVFMETIRMVLAGETITWDKLASEKKLPKGIYKTITKGQGCGSE